MMNDDDTITELRAGLVAAFSEVFDLKVRVADLQACNARQAEQIAQAAKAIRKAIEMTGGVHPVVGDCIRTALQAGMPPNITGETR